MYIIVSLGWWNNLYDYIFINNWFGFSPIKYLAGGGGGDFLSSSLCFCYWIAVALSDKFPGDKQLN